MTSSTASTSNGRAIAGPEIPSESSYWSARSTLLSTEAAHKREALLAPSSSRSELESQADRAFQNAKNSGLSMVWEPNKEDLRNFPGMPFREAIDRGMRNNTLWMMIEKMPKGSLLHCHMDGTVSATWLIDAALRYDSIIHIRAESPLLDPKDLYEVQVSLKPMPALKSYSSSSNIFSPDYDTDEWMPLKEARKLFPFKSPYTSQLEGFVRGTDIPSAEERSPSEAGLVDWLHSLMAMTPAPGSKPMGSSPEAWARFESTFAIIGGVISYEPILASYLKEMVLVHAQDNIQYLETRLNFIEETYVSTDAVTPLPHSRWVEIFRTSVAEANAELRAAGRGECQCKIIYATVRFVTPERLRWYTEDCLQLARAHPDLIIGFDLVGHEDPLLRLREYVPELLRFKQRQVEEGLDIPLILHAGETLGDGNGTDENLYDALLLDSKRLGHAYSLPKHPELMKLCRERNVCVESCPISNEVLRYVNNMASHPLPILVNHGVPVALSNDDPCQFGNFGLSHDFWQVCNASHATGLAALKTFALTSLEHSRLTPEERVRHMKRFDNDWEQWLTWIIESFGEKPKEQNGRQGKKRKATEDIRTKQILDKLNSFDLCASDAADLDTVEVCKFVLSKATALSREIRDLLSE